MQILPRKHRAAAVAFVAVALAATPRARACGVSTADGLSSCSLAEHEEATRPRWRLGASASYTSTAIDFGGGFVSPETRGAVIASLAYQPTPRWTLQVAAGSTVGGHLDTPAGQYNFSPGPTGAIGASWRAVAGTKPFVILTSNLSFSASGTEVVGAGPSGSLYMALDLRLGAIVGTTIARVFSPYAVGRVFGGPVIWAYQGEDVGGTDTHHYQLGAGLSVAAFGPVNVFVEGVPLGERSFAGGTAFAF